MPIVTYIPLQFVDETGINPLPAGIEVKVYAVPYLPGLSAPLVNTWTTPGGGTQMGAPPGPCAITFSGSFQAPSAIINTTIVNPPSGPFIVTVAPYRSPSKAQTGYANFQIGKLPKGWFGDDARAPGGIAFGIGDGYGEALANIDQQVQICLQEMRLQSSVNAQIDSWENDMVGSMFGRYTNEVNNMFRARTELMVSRPRTTLNAIKAFVQAFYNSINSVSVQLGEELGFGVPGAGAYGVSGGFGVTPPLPTTPPPPPPTITVWDAMSMPGLAAQLSVVAPQFVIQIGLIEASLAQQLAFGVAGGFGTQGGFSIVNEDAALPELSNAAPDPRLGLLINWLAKGAGTVPLYLVGIL